MPSTPPTRRRALLRALLGVPAAIGAARARAQTPDPAPSTPAAPASSGAPAANPAASSSTLSGVPVAPPRSRVLTFFNSEEAAAMDAVAARLIPADALGPGAREAGVTRFLDGQLAGAWGAGDQLYRQGPFQAGAPEQGYQLSFTPAEMFRLGLRKLDEACRSERGQPFAALPPADQDAVLKRLEGGELDFSPLPAAVFFQAMLEGTIEGFFADPIYGGNQDMVGWKLVGFPGAHASYSTEIERHGVAWTRPPVSIADARAHPHADAPEAR